LPTALDWSEVDWDKERFPDPPMIVLGAYRRGSTYGQRDGARFQESFEGLRRIAFSEGYGLMYFDEGTRSGHTLAGRATASNMLGFLEWDLIDGIIAPDIKRLTRDHTMQDGDEIARVLLDRQRILITAKPKRVWHLTDPDDYRDYRREVFEAGDDWLEIRTMFWGGMKDRADQVLDNRWPPFFRCRVAFGYKQVVCYERRPGAPHSPGHWGRERWTTDPDASNGKALSGRGHVARTWLKDPAMAHTMAELRDVMLSQPTTGEVLRELRDRGIRNPSGHARRQGDVDWTWPAAALYRLLRAPIYGGTWQWIAQPGETILWKHFDPTVSVDVPELAWWSAAEHEEFCRKFLESYSARRRTVLAHPFAGLARCTTCGASMEAGGKQPHVQGELKGQLACANRYKGCPAPIFMAEDAVRRALDSALPTYLSALPKRLSQLRDEIERDKADPLSAQLEFIKRRQAGLQKIANDPDAVTDEVLAEMRELNTQKRALEAKRAAQPVAVAEAEMAKLIVLMDSEPDAVYAEMTLAEKASFWRLVLRCRRPDCDHDTDGSHVDPPYIDMVRRAAGGSKPRPAVYRVRDVELNAQQPLTQMSIYYAFSLGVGGAWAAD